MPAVFFVLTTLWFVNTVRGGDDDRRGGGQQRGRNNRRRKGGRGGNANFSRGGSLESDRPLGPVEELYDDIYDDLAGQNDINVPPLLKLLNGPKRNGMQNGIDRPTSKLNIGIPKSEQLKVTNLNSKYDSYRYSMVKATRGKAFAASELRRKGFEDALVRALGVPSGGNVGLTSAEGTALLKLERDFLAEGSQLLKDVAELSREITNAAVIDELDAMGVEAGVLDAIVEKKNDTVIDAEVVGDEREDTSIKSPREKREEEGDKSKKVRKIEKQADFTKAIREVEAINTEILLLELAFIQSVVEVLGPNRADAIRTTLVGNMINGDTGMLLKSLKERPLAVVLSSFVHGTESGAVARRPNLFVTRFSGDVSASQVNDLREEVTGILRASQPGDEVLMILQSGGGTVTGYGLSAAQLQRFKTKGLKLTICVEQVAASGGYMMCCTADRIVASPFAVLGSIGVISDIPNAYERLKQEGIEFQTITAGKYKRTVTPTKKVTKEDLKKSEEDINDILKLFKAFVKSQRPQLDIENVATGETWFGEDALAKGLCDEIATADDVLLEFVDNGYDVYEVAYNPTTEGVGALLTGLPSRGSVSDATGWRGLLRSTVRSVVSSVKDEVMSELSSSFNDVSSVERRYMAKDPSNAAERIQVRD